MRLPEGLTFVRIGCGQDGAVLLLDLLHVLRQLFYTASDLLHLNQKHTRTKSVFKHDTTFISHHELVLGPQSVITLNLITACLSQALVFLQLLYGLKMWS